VSSTAPAHLYAEPRVVTDPAECYFYHSLELPGHGLIEGEWDLRGGERAYLGGVDLAGKSVLEIGTASGHLCAYMEGDGADVVSYDLSPEHSLDVVPYARYDNESYRLELKSHIAQLNNAYWLVHSTLGLRARMVYGTVYDIPRELGAFDVATLGSVLLHLRDPLLALQNVLAHTRDTVIVADRGNPRLLRFPVRISDKLGRALFFRPVAAESEPKVTWWRLTPQVVQKMIAVFGFEDSRVTYSTQMFEGHKRTVFTVVGRRTHGTPLAPSGGGAAPGGGDRPDEAEPDQG
jgi:Methyltransferase domain